MGHILKKYKKIFLQDKFRISEIPIFNLAVYMKGENFESDYECPKGREGKEKKKGGV